MYNDDEGISGSGEVISTAGPSRDAVKKLDQIIQVGISSSSFASPY
jgi:hypothetical protein